MVVEIVSKNQKLFAKDSIFWVRFIIFLQIVIIAALITFIYFQYNNDPKPIYFSLKKGDQLIDSVSLEKPSLTEAELLNWTTEAMIFSFSFNYHNYGDVMESITDYFDTLGKESYMKMITEHPQIKEVISKKLILSGRPTAAPRIIKDGVVDGRYAWQINFPFVFKFRNQQLTKDIEVILDIFVVRVPEKQAPLGVKIVSIEGLSKVN